jgi:hypothetical protein
MMCRYDQFLCTVPLLEALTRPELTRLADALESVSFVDGSLIIQQVGCRGKSIESQELLVVKKNIIIFKN